MRLSMIAKSASTRPSPFWGAPRTVVKPRASSPLFFGGTQHPLTQPSTCILPLASTAAGIPLSLMRTSPWMVWAGSCQPTLLMRKVFHSKLTEWQIWLPRKSSQVETELRIIFHIGLQVQWMWFFLSSLLLRLLSEFSPYPDRTAFSGQQQAAFKIMWRRPAWCFTTLIAETVILMCSSSLHIIIS